MLSLELLSDEGGRGRVSQESALEEEWSSAAMGTPRGRPHETRRPQEMIARRAQLHDRQLNLRVAERRHLRTQVIPRRTANNHIDAFDAHV